jgi:hypothetical protein
LSDHRRDPQHRRSSCAPPDRRPLRRISRAHQRNQVLPAQPALIHHLPLSRAKRHRARTSPSEGDSSNAAARQPLLGGFLTRMSSGVIGARAGAVSEARAGPAVRHSTLGANRVFRPCHPLPYAVPEPPRRPLRLLSTPRTRVKAPAEAALRTLAGVTRKHANATLSTAACLRARPIDLRLQWGALEPA